MNLPISAEAAFLRSAVSQTDARLALLGAEISRLRDQLRGLEEEHASLSRYPAQNSDILSPLRRIPAERQKFQITDSPWIFTHVNRRWRAIAISNPSLWSRVVISYRPHINPSRLYPLAMVQTHIARAQKLKIHFYGCQKSDPRPQMETFHFLAEHAFRRPSKQRPIVAHIADKLGRSEESNKRGVHPLLRDSFGLGRRRYPE
ncbi:hypothetical protein C8R43DRAFT_1010541 [Mycena crocata]|nr:hypothetical protein C8R43DRAFT_1010541 [Mycena crocata]